MLSKRLLFIGCLLCIAGCSQVSLSYGLGILSVPDNQGQSPSTNSPGQPAVNLARLNILGKVQTGNLSLDNLRLRLSVISPGGASQIQEVSLQAFLANPSVLFANLLPGQSNLKIELINAENQTLSQLQSLVNLQGTGAIDFQFVLEPGVQPGTFTLRSESAESVAPSGSASATPAPEGPGASAKPGSRDQDDKDPAVPSIELNLRLVSQSSDRATIIWEAPANLPAGQTISAYRILVNGEVIEQNYPNTNYNLRDLDEGRTAEVQIIAILSNGTLFGVDQLSIAVESSGGGGGGGGGNSSGPNNPPVDASPVIHSLSVSSSAQENDGIYVLPGTAYPVKLTVNASDDNTLSNTSYSWSCLNCGAESDDSFSPDTDSDSHTGSGAQVIWTAPSQPGTYTLQVSVDDGVNQPVTQSLQITVKNDLADVTVIGEYE